MPNWCMNILLVEGPDPDIDDFYYRAWGYNLSLPLDDYGNEFVPLQFENFVPVDEFHRSRNITVWGCDGRIDVGQISRRNSGLGREDRSELRYSFDTAWSPPDEWFAEIVKQYPQCDFELHYIEPGNGIAGTLYGSDGSSYAERHEVNQELLEDWGFGVENGED